MIKASHEQECIVNLVNNANIIIDSVAGSGKTSTVLFIAEQYANLGVLVLTYNAQLKAETRKRAAHLSNLDVHSYHSFCVMNYNPLAYTDDGINTIINENTTPKFELNYDIIIVDEAQDITPLFYKLLCKIFTDNQKEFKIVVMGDQMQSIYKFRESDSRFITFSEQIFEKFNNFPWTSATLSESFRCTIPMTNFINECMIGYKRINSKKESIHKPDYVICNSYGTYPRKLVKDYLKIYKPQDIFILAYSVKDKTPIRNLANYITENFDIPIYCSGSDQDSLDSRVIEGKLVLTSIHQAKGRERKVVIFLGFDDGYFEYYDKNSDQSICPNELYVAATRASERVSFIQDQKKAPLPFLKNVRMYSKFIDESKDTIVKKSITINNTETFTVSELVSYLPFSIENLCANYLNISIIKTAEYKLDIPNIIKMEEGNFESVADITGIAIPAYFEYLTMGNSTIITKNLIENNIRRLENDGTKNDTKLAMITKLKKFSTTLKKFHKKQIEPIDIKNISVSDLLKISLYYSSQQNKTDYKLKQITSFDWLTQFMLDEGTKRMQQAIGSSDILLFEESVDKEYNNTNRTNISIIGEIDCIDHTNKIVYEFKCTKDLTISHVIQLGIYMYLFGDLNYKYRLFNVFTNEIKEISSSKSKLEEMIRILVEHKLANYSHKTDDEFLKQFKKLPIINE